MLEDVLACKTMLTVDAIVVKAAKNMWNPDTCTYQNTADYHRNTDAPLIHVDYI